MNQAQISQIREIVKKNPSLIWYTKNYDSLNEEAVAEAVYNSGTWDDICEFHKTVGLSEAKELFYKLNKKSRSNLRPIVSNYFNLYYGRHSS